MSNYWVTPEELAKIKKRNKTILYTCIPIITFVLTALITLLIG
ncbi:hypothetical protein [Metabacillus schmidteae]|nr:hypothetical protein [Metabacillus schmidteae]